jgi:hypothetical protein
MGAFLLLRIHRFRAPSAVHPTSIPQENRGVTRRRALPEPWGPAGGGHRVGGRGGLQAVPPDAFAPRAGASAGVAAAGRPSVTTAQGPSRRSPRHSRAARTGGCHLWWWMAPEGAMRLGDPFAEALPPLRRSRRRGADGGAPQARQRLQPCSTPRDPLARRRERKRCGRSV